MTKFDSVSSSRAYRHFDDPVENQDDRVQVYIARQEHKIAELKSTYNQLRNRLSEVERDYKLDLIRVQGQLSTVKRRRKDLEKRRDDIKSSKFNLEKQKIARELIEEIWSTLTTYRRNLFSMRDDFPEPEPEPVSSPIPSYAHTVHDSIGLEDISDSGDLTVPLPQTPTVIDTPVIAETPTPMNDTPVAQCDEYESIASRRTRRAKAANVYYKEPSLRAALTPGDPYTFSLDSGIITPTVPDGYTRETPTTRNSRTRRRK